MARKLAIGAGLLVALAAVGLVALSRPAFLNLLGRHCEPLLGFRFELEDVSLGPGRAEARGLVLATSTMRASIPQAKATGSLLAMRLEDIDVTGATFHYVYDPAGPPTDLRALIEGLPAVNRLRLRRSRADIVAKDGAWRAQAAALDLSVDNFSPKCGGSFNLAGQIDLRTRDGATLAKGEARASGKLSALLPHPVGRAELSAELAGQAAGRRLAALSIRLPVEAAEGGLIRLSPAALTAKGLEAGPRIKLAQAALSLPATIDLARRRLTLTKATAEAEGLGTVRLEASATWGGGAYEWRASASAEGLDVASLKEVAGPLSPTLAQWQAGGRAALAAALSGRWRQGLSYAGDVRLRLAGGSFSSPDFTKAGENIAATLHLKLKSAGRQKAACDLEAALSEGQVLAGGVLADLAEVRPHLAASGCFFLPGPRAPRGLRPASPAAC